MTALSQSDLPGKRGRGSNDSLDVGDSHTRIGAPESGSAIGFGSVAAEAMVPRMRLLLAACVLMTVLIDPVDVAGSSRLAWLFATGYLIHSVVAYFLQERRGPLAGGRILHWCDVVWYAAIVATTGGIDSIFFLFFLFAILTVSFRFGLEEGTRVTVASATLFAGCVLLPGYELDLPMLLMRTAFLLGFGYMSAHWGESRVRNAQRLALLLEVSRLSNPRFGVDRTITAALESVRNFYHAQTCLMVLRDADTGAFSLRTVRAGAGTQVSIARPIEEEAGCRLLAMPPDQICAYRRSPGPIRSLFALRPPAFATPGALDLHSLQCLAALLEANTFITAPVAMQRGRGRLYVLSDDGRFSRNDALFLNHVVVQAFAVIDNIDLLDCIASQAAATERKKMGLDLHDAAIQPYVGLQLGLSAVRNKASPENPLIADIDRLLAMANEVIADLRNFAGKLSHAPQQHEPVFLEALRKKVAQVRKYYGIELTLTAEDVLGLSDRVAAEALQLVSEGLSNICKHTNARRGAIAIRCEQHALKISIENDGQSEPRPQFVPRSIADRAQTLGGRVAVGAGVSGGTAVLIEIPV